MVISEIFQRRSKSGTTLAGIILLEIVLKEGVAGKAVGIVPGTQQEGVGATGKAITWEITSFEISKGLLG
jgi:hypothetical protein